MYVVMLIDLKKLVAPTLTPLTLKICCARRFF